MKTAPSLEYVMRGFFQANTFVQIMCIQPPLLSVGVLQPGQGLLVTLIVRELGSAPFHLAPKALGSVGSKLQRRMLNLTEGRYHHFTWGALGPPQKPHRQGDTLLNEPPEGSP